MNGSTCMVRFISLGRSIVLGPMTEDREVAPNNDESPETDRPKKALTSISSVSGSESSSNSSMERLLKQVRAFVVRTDSGAAEAAAQQPQQCH